MPGVLAYEKIKTTYIHLLNSAVSLATRRVSKTTFYAMGIVSGWPLDFF